MTLTKKEIREIKKERREDKKKLAEWKKDRKKIKALIDKNDKALKRLKKQGWLK